MSSHITSRLTDRYQTTIPEAVRQHLALQKRDRIEYVLEADGSIRLLRAGAEEDPALRPFLSLLEADIATHPQRLVSLEGLREELEELTAGVEVDLNAPLDGE